MNANKVNPENLDAVRYLWEIHLYKLMDGPITALDMLDCDWSVQDVLSHKFIEVIFSKLNDNNQFFRNEFDCIVYHLCKISIIEC